MTPLLDLLLLLATLGLAACFRPWLALSGTDLQHPWLAALVVLPWAWALHATLPGGMLIHVSGACLLVLMLGWPLAVWTISLVALAGAALLHVLGQAPAPWSPGALDATLTDLVWHGLVPATLGLLLGLMTRRWLPRHLFVYILARAFIATALAMMGAAALEVLALGHAAQTTLGDLLVARWLMAWGEAVATGMLVAIFVAFKPSWLLTYSDLRYLPKD